MQEGDLGKKTWARLTDGTPLVTAGKIGQGWTVLFHVSSDASWSNFREVGLYEVTAQAIRRGLEVGAMTMADIWGEDRPVWKKLLDHHDPELARLLSLVNRDTQFVWDDEAPSFSITTKIRTIDPDILVNRSLHKLSNLDNDYARRRQIYIDRKQMVWPMRIIPPGR